MSDQPLNDFLAVCRQFDQAMLVTQHTNGGLAARPMYIASIEEDGDLWFATDIDSGKVHEILASPQVCVTMAGGGNYASISGQAKLVDDRATIDRLWSEPWRVWFPEGKDDPSLVLINVSATEGEFWSNSGANRIKYLFSAIKAYATGHRPQVDRAAQGKVQL